MSDPAHPDDNAIPASDPIALFEAWYAEARLSELNDSNAMALATASASGAPSVRMVLLKGHGDGTFVFYTNSHSRKGQEIAANGQAALLFHWKSLRRQVRIEGVLEPVDPTTSDAYFASRSRDSQLGAVASDQSAVLSSREEFLERFADAEAQYEGRDVVRPPHWMGYRLTPSAIEFWIDRAHRLHERRQFVCHEGKWTSELLYP